MKVVIAVPARINSSRLPGKVLEDIAGKPMIQHVLERCKKSKLASSVVLCTDSNELISKSKSWNIDALLTSSDCNSGSERISSIVDKLALNEALENTLILKGHFMGTLGRSPRN